MKKFVSILLILVLVFSMSAVAMAASADVASPETGNTDVENNNPDSSPQTGDNSHIWLWILLASGSLAGVIAISIVGRKKRKSL